jgi:dephospho-CoA kinase
MKVAITGSSYSGYEDVTKLFESRGVMVFDADVVLKFILNYRTDLLDTLRIRFGNTIFDSKGFLIPEKFDTTEKFDRVLDVVWMEVIFLYEKWRLRYVNEAYTLFKCAIIFEYKKDQDFDKVINVFRPKDERMQDYQRNEKNGHIYSYVHLSKEMSDIDKNAKTTYVFNNYPSHPAPVEVQIDTFNRSLLSSAAVINDMPLLTRKNSVWSRDHMTILGNRS